MGWLHVWFRFHIRGNFGPQIQRKSGPTYYGPKDSDVATPLFWVCGLEAAKYLNNADWHSYHVELLGALLSAKRGRHWPLKLSVASKKGSIAIHAIHAILALISYVLMRLTRITSSSTSDFLWTIFGSRNWPLHTSWIRTRGLKGKTLDPQSASEIY